MYPHLTLYLAKSAGVKFLTMTTAFKAFGNCCLKLSKLIKGIMKSALVSTILETVETPMTQWPTEKQNGYMITG